MPANVTISNVPGPRQPLYFAGARMDNYIPVSTIADGMGLNITVHSYMNRLDFGLIADRELVPDLWDMVDMHIDEIARLFDATGAEWVEPQRGTGDAPRRQLRQAGPASRRPPRRRPRQEAAGEEVRRQEDRRPRRPRPRRPRPRRPPAKKTAAKKTRGEEDRRPRRPRRRRPPAKKTAAKKTASVQPDAAMSEAGRVVGPVGSSRGATSARR